MLVNKEKKIILLQNPKTGGRFKASEKSRIKALYKEDEQIFKMYGL